MNDLLYLVVLSLSSVVALFVIAKLLGKRQVVQLEFMDYVIGISIGSISAEMATDINDKPLYFYSIAMAIYFLFDLIITYLGKKSPGLKHFFKGKPLTIIYNGEIDYKILKKSKLDIDDVLTLTRSQGYFNIEDIAFAIFENNGKLSIMPKAEKRPTIAQNIKNDIEPSKLPICLITDGIISKSSLNKLNKDKQWLLDNLKIRKHKELKKNIIGCMQRRGQEHRCNL